MFVVKQSKHNPVLHPIKNHNWEEVAACNGCPIQVGDKIKIVYRAIANPDRMDAPNLFRSSIGVAESRDGIHFTHRDQLLSPENEWEKYGCEDPRVTKINNWFYVFYTALSSGDLNKDTIKVGLAKTKDLKEIKERHLVTPFNSKAMALFPEKINGKFVAILSVDTDNPPVKVAIATFDKEEDIWNQKKWHRWYKKINKHTLNIAKKDTDLTEVGAPPIKTKDGWLVVYSHIQNYFSDEKTIFGVEAVLLDLKDPTKIIGRTPYPFLIPDQLYSKYGFVSNVSFPTGALLKGDTLSVYYGAADTTTCVAKLSLSRLLQEMREDTRTLLFTRVGQAPVLEPIAHHKWESRDVFNPAAIDLGGKVHILYRAMSEDNTSTIGYATSKDGITIKYRHPKPIYEPREDFEQKKGDPKGNSGCEDPRLTKIGDTIFMAYTAYNGVDAPRIAISSIKVKNFLKGDFSTWSRPVAITPKSLDDKDGVLMPKKFKNGYLVIHRISNHICGDYVNDLSFEPNEIDTCFEILEPRAGMWDSKKVGIAGTPHYTSKGWLMFYHGVSEDGIYRVGAVLLDKKDPTEIIARSTYPIFEPETIYEKEGEVPNVVFPCGSVIRKGTIYLYYGAADRCIGIAEAKLSELLKSLT